MAHNVSPDHTPRRLTRKEFGDRLARLCKERHWQQTDLVQHSGVTRQNISSYFRGKSFPQPKALEAIARALNVKPEFLLPNHVMGAITADEDPPLEIKVANDGSVHLRVNQILDMGSVAAITDILSKYRDKAND